MVGKCGIRFPDLGDNADHGVLEAIPYGLSSVLGLFKLATSATPTASLTLAMTIAISSSNFRTRGSSWSSRARSASSINL